MGKIEIDIVRIAAELKDEFKANSEVISKLKDYVKSNLKEKYGEKIKLWRDKGMNLIMYVDKKEENQILMDRALYINNRVYVRLRPVVEKGSIDPRYYRIKINLDYRLSAELAIIELEKKWRIWEVEIEADFGVGNGTIVAYVWFDSMEQIYALGSTLEIIRTRCHISHRWSYTCNVCKGRGHFEKDCQDVEDMRQIKERIDRESGAIERQRSTNTQVYYCQTLIKPDIIITSIDCTRQAMTMQYQRGVIASGEKTKLEIAENESKEEAFMRLLRELEVYKFAICNVEVEELKKLPIRQILYTNSVSQFLGACKRDEYIKNCTKFKNQRTDLSIKLKNLRFDGIDTKLIDIERDSWRYEKMKSTTEMKEEQSKRNGCSCQKFTKNKRLRHLGCDKT